MARRSRFAAAAEDWLQQHAKGRAVSSDELWTGLSNAHPELTSATPERKTPRTTCMRDLRKDPAFVVGDRKVKLSKQEAI
jgi:hypothetical protein